MRAERPVKTATSISLSRWNPIGVRLRAVEVGAVFGLRPWSLDVVVYTPAEVARLSKVRGTLLSIIEAEGEVLYKRR